MTGEMIKINRLAQFQQAHVGPVETFVVLANAEFKHATKLFDHSAMLMYDREVIAETVRMSCDQ